MGEDGKALIRQLVEIPNISSAPRLRFLREFRVPNESPHPMFIQVDFGLVRDAGGDLQPKLVELQAFPSLYAYQPVLSQAYMDVFGLDPKLRYFLERTRLRHRTSSFFKMRSSPDTILRMSS